MDARRLITGKPKHNFTQIKQLKIGQNEHKYKKYYKNTKNILIKYSINHKIETGYKDMLLTNMELAPCFYIINSVSIHI